MRWSYYMLQCTRSPVPPHSPPSLRQGPGRYLSKRHCDAEWLCRLPLACATLQVSRKTSNSKSTDKEDQKQTMGAFPDGLSTEPTPGRHQPGLHHSRRKFSILCLGTQVVNAVGHARRNVDVSRRVLGVDVEVVRGKGVLVEGARLLAVKEVRKSGRIGQAEDAPSVTVSIPGRPCRRKRPTRARAWGRTRWRCSPAS